MVEIKTSKNSPINGLHTMLKHKQKQQKEDAKYESEGQADSINKYPKQTYYGQRKLCNKESFLNFNKKLFINFSVSVLILSLLFLLRRL